VWNTSYLQWSITPDSDFDDLVHRESSFPRAARGNQESQRGCTLHASGKRPNHLSESLLYCCAYAIVPHNHGAIKTVEVKKGRGPKRRECPLRTDSSPDMNHAFRDPILPKGLCWVATVRGRHITSLKLLKNLRYITVHLSESVSSSFPSFTSELSGDAGRV